MGSLGRKLKRAQDKENRLHIHGKTYFKQVAEDMYTVGICRCGGSLNAYLGSKPENRFNIYCTKCGSISDIRVPKAGDDYNLQTGQTPLQVLIEGYKTFKDYEITSKEVKETPMSAIVNDEHGEIHGEI